MPVVIPNGYEEKWTEQVKESDELKSLLSNTLIAWSPNGWISEKLNNKTTHQMRLF